MALKIVANVRRLVNDDRFCSFVKGEDGAKGVRGQSGQRGGHVSIFFLIHGVLNGKLCLSFSHFFSLSMLGSPQSNQETILIFFYLDKIGLTWFSFSNEAVG